LTEHTISKRREEENEASAWMFTGITGLEREREIIRVGHGLT
jgi:hypothetical protein